MLEDLLKRCELERFSAKRKRAINKQVFNYLSTFLEPKTNTLSHKEGRGFLQRGTDCGLILNSSLAYDSKLPKIHEEDSVMHQVGGEYSRQKGIDLNAVEH